MAGVISYVIPQPDALTEVSYPSISTLLHSKPAQRFTQKWGTPALKACERVSASQLTLPPRFKHVEVRVFET